MIKRETTELVFDAPGDYLVPEAGARAPEAEGDEPEAEGAVLGGAGSGSLRRVPSRGGAVAAAIAAMERSASTGAMAGTGSGGGGDSSGGGQEADEARAAAHKLTETLFASVAGAK